MQKHSAGALFLTGAMLCALQCATPCIAGGSPPSPVGYYEIDANTDVFGAKGRLCIRPGTPGTYQVQIATIYCSGLSEGCASGVPGGADFTSRLIKRHLKFFDAATACSIDIKLGRNGAYVDQSIGKCRDTFPYDNAGGFYVLKKAALTENSCAP
jgi:hypothetical protein